MIFNTTGRLFKIHSNAFLQKKMFFFMWGILHWFMVLLNAYRCSFGPILMENYVFFFSNAYSILELMLCNWNLTKLDILTLLSSECTALRPLYLEYYTPYPRWLRQILGISHLDLVSTEWVSERAKVPASPPVCSCCPASAPPSLTEPP